MAAVQSFTLARWENAMKLISWVLCGALLCSLTARAEGSDVSLSSSSASRRGTLSAVGIGLTGLGAVAAGFGVHFLLDAADAKRNVDFYAPNGGAPESRNVFAYDAELQRSSGSNLVGIVLVSAAAASIAGGIVMLVLDTPAAPSVAFVPTQGGGAMVFSTRF
jgi:hypothetical protein